ncbi:MAG: hypothetical protein BWX44_01598 [Spirochaetes bacterium ADurb.Bin001]|nr:MAG: hypothetical protein BWX44_01598 [Spirochaetes bacterium ADurb.Bin001]
MVIDGIKPKPAFEESIPGTCPRKGITARENPRKRLPESPMNILALGMGKLNNRNPTITPAMHRQISELD